MTRYLQVHWLQENVFFLFNKILADTNGRQMQGQTKGQRIQCLFNKAEKWSWNGNIIMVLDKHAKIQNQMITQFKY